MEFLFVASTSLGVRDYGLRVFLLWLVGLEARDVETDRSTPGHMQPQTLNPQTYQPSTLNPKP